MYMARMHIHSDTRICIAFPSRDTHNISKDVYLYGMYAYTFRHSVWKHTHSLPEMYAYTFRHMSHHHTHIHSDTRIRISFYCITSSYTYVTSSYIVHTFYLYTFKHTHSHLFPFQRYAYKNKKTKTKRHCIRIHRNLAQILRTNQTKFEDPTFPADATSLFSDPR